MTGSRAENRRATAAVSLSAAVWFTWALLFVALGILASFRRLLGAYAVPPSLAALIGGAILIAGSAAALRWMLWRTVAAAWPPGCYYTAMGGLSAALLLWTVGLTIGGAPIAGLAVLWTLVAAEEGITWPLLVRRRAVRSGDAPAGCDRSFASAAGAAHPQPVASPANTVRPSTGPVEGCPEGSAAVTDSESVSQPRGGPDAAADSTSADEPLWADRAESAGANAADADAVVQQLTRTKPPDGPEMIVGWLRLPLAPGQRSGVLHVAFCPPLEGRPTIEFEQVEGPPARIKLTQAFSYGARFDLKLTQPAEEADAVVVQFAASADMPSPSGGAS